MSDNSPQGRHAGRARASGRRDFHRFVLRAAGLLVLAAALLWAGWRSPWARRGTDVSVDAVDPPRAAPPAPAPSPPSDAAGGVPARAPVRADEDPRPVDIYGVGDGGRGRPAPSQSGVPASSGSHEERGPAAPATGPPE